MIIINVQFAETNTAYDFKVEETRSIGQIIEDMVGMIAEREHIALSRQPGVFLLCNREKQQIFQPEKTLFDYQVSYGDTLFLV